MWLQTTTVTGTTLKAVLSTLASDCIAIFCTCMHFSRDRYFCENAAVHFSLIIAQWTSAYELCCTVCAMSDCTNLCLYENTGNDSVFFTVTKGLHRATCTLSHNSNGIFPLVRFPLIQTISCCVLHVGTEYFRQSRDLIILTVF